jgi:hypothetical protein
MLRFTLYSRVDRCNCVFVSVETRKFVMWKLWGDYKWIVLYLIVPLWMLSIASGLLRSTVWLLSFTCGLSPSKQCSDYCHHCCYYLYAIFINIHMLIVYIVWPCLLTCTHEEWHFGARSLKPSMTSIKVKCSPSVFILDFLSRGLTSSQSTSTFMGLVWLAQHSTITSMSSIDFFDFDSVLCEVRTESLCILEWS